MNEKEKINPISETLMQVAINFERKYANAVLILPEQYRSLRHHIVVRLCAESDYCGIIGYALHNPRKHTRLRILFENDLCHEPLGECYLLEYSEYTSVVKVNELVSHVTGKHEKYTTYQKANKKLEQLKHE